MNLSRTKKVILAIILFVSLTLVVTVSYIFIFLLNFPTKLQPVDTEKLAVERSKYIGKEITLDPKSRLVKVENYGGPDVDKYFHVLHVNSDVVDRYELKVERIINIERTVIFKVVGVDFLNSNVHAYYFCLLESNEFPGQVAQHDCSKLENIHQ